MILENHLGSTVSGSPKDQALRLASNYGTTFRRPALFLRQRAPSSITRCGALPARFVILSARRNIVGTFLEHARCALGTSDRSFLYAKFPPERSNPRAVNAPLDFDARFFRDGCLPPASPSTRICVEYERYVPKRILQLQDQD
jgi:hypothetical protein